LPDKLEATKDDGRDVDEGVNIIAAMPFTAKSNMWVHSALGINILLPMRSTT